MAASKLSIWLGLAAAAAAILHWAVYQFGYAINSDNALMVEYARRWLAGGTVGVDIFDPNPPGSFLIYVPAVFMAKLMPVWHAITLYTLAAVALSVAAVWKLLPGVGVKDDSRIAVTLIYLLGNLFLTNIFFGERDHFIFLALMPFVLLQLSYLNRADIKPSRFEWAVLILGAMLIVVKPHYGLMPVVLILWRAWDARSLKAVCGPDVKAVAGAVIGYALLLVLLFPGYLSDVMPEVVAVYAADTDKNRLSMNVMALFMAGLAWALYTTTNASPENRKLVLALMLFVAALLAANLAQLKGYYYQAMPQFITILVVVSYMLLSVLKDLRVTSRFAAGLTVLLVVGVCYAAAPPATTYPTHQTFKATAINKLYENCPHQPCNVFIFDEYPDIAVQAAVYNDAVFPSRFPSYWFLPELAIGSEAIRRDKSHPLATSEIFQQSKDKYQAMVVDDMVRYKPDVLAVIRTNLTMPDETEFSFQFIKFFSENEDFAAFMKGYKKAGTLEIDRREYHRGTTLEAKKKDIFDVYRHR